MGSDFVVQSKGHCFFCLIKIDFVQLEHCQTDSTSSLICSLQSLSRHLKLDMRKVFSEKEAIPQHLLDQVQNSKLKVELCEKCAPLNKKFAKLYRQLEKIEMEVASSLKLIHETLLTAEETGKTGRLKNLSGLEDNANDEWSEKIKILDVIRKETIQKSSNQLQSCYHHQQPRVKVQNMTKMKILEEKEKLISSSSSSLKIHYDLLESFSEAISDPVTEMDSIKAERLHDNCEAGNYPPENDDWDMQSRHSSAMDPDDLMTRSNEDEIIPRETSRSREELTSSSTANLIYEELAPPGLSLEGMPNACPNPKTGKHKCPTCLTEFGRVDDYRQHYKSIHLKIRYKCKLCEKIFSRISGCHAHYRNVHRGIRYKCRGCAKLFTEKSHLTQHQRKTGCGIKPE